ncbi:MAG: quinol:cytochrome C oxidoreductase [Hymenobacteraceae bacterium]|nr:quinol:cytochrome C oxidoreductase [Hymenobacteraceae bacterium]
MLPKKVSNLFLMMMGAGVLLLIVGIFFNLNLGHEVAAVGGHGGGHAAAGGHEAGHHAVTWVNRLFANLWLNNIWFTGISVIGMFFISLQYVAYAYWSVPIKRVLESLTGYLPVGAVLMVVLFLLGKSYLFHWTQPGIMDEGSANYDPIIAGKSGYLNLPFYLIRTVVYLAIWVIFARWMRAQSVAEGLEGGTVRYHKSIKIAAIFLVLFAVSNSMANWDWLMSIDSHWFSTMYSWYVFASWLVSGVAATILIAVNLKQAGYLRILNANHLHDLGKFAFGFTIFWTYVWFAQFMLIWYANLPEEVTYFQERWFGHFAPLFYMSLLINFVAPFLLLMTRDAKRQGIMLKIVTVVILSGHYIDFYMMVMPGTMGNDAGFGFMEVGTLLLFLGIFLTMVSRMLVSASLIQHKHPFLEESLHHHI